MQGDTNSRVNSAIIDLIEWGRLSGGNHPPSTALRERLSRLGTMNCRHWEDWEKDCASLNREKLEQLIMGLTLVEKELQWPGGSVSGVIWTHRVFEKQYPNDAAPLADWILKHTQNPYVPFGDNHGGVSTLEEYHLYQMRRARRRTDHEANERADREARQERLKNRAELAQLHEAKARVRTSERQDFLKPLQSKPLQERLETAVADDRHSIKFYPETDALEAANHLGDLPTTLLQDLRAKLDHRHRGAWGKLNRQLENFLRHTTGAASSRTDDGTASGLLLTPSASLEGSPRAQLEQ